MKMLKVMEKRRSVRDYKDKPLDAKDLELVKEDLLNIPQVVPGQNVKLTLFEGSQVFERLSGVAGYNGTMIAAPHYVVITSCCDARGLKASGYAGEWFVLNVTKRDIATCWISTNHNEDRIHQLLDLPTGEEVVGLIALGYAKGEMRVSNIYAGQAQGVQGMPAEKTMSYRHVDSEYVEAPVSGRMSIEEIVYHRTWGQKTTIEYLETLGYAGAFFYMRLAPSTANRQPWRFVIDKDRFILAMSKEDGYDDDRLAMIEGGIAMLYFEVAMHDAGYPGQWQFEAVDAQVGIPENYFIAGTYTFM